MAERKNDNYKQNPDKNPEKDRFWSGFCYKNRYFCQKIVNSARMLNYIYKMCMVKMKSYNIYKMYEIIIKKWGGRIYGS